MHSHQIPLLGEDAEMDQSVNGAHMANDETSHTPQLLLAELSETLQAGNPFKDESIRQNALRLSSLLTASFRSPNEIAFETCFLVFPS